MTDQNTAAAPGFKLSPQQESAWLAAEGSPSFARCTVAIHGPLDVHRLSEALAEIVRRHEILRTTFVKQAGMRVPSQVIHDELPPAIDIVRGESENGETAFDLVNGPILHAVLLSRSPSEHVLALTLPGVCADRMTLLLLLGELAAFYSGATAAGEPLQYADYAEWRWETLTSGSAVAQGGREFWAQREPRRELPPLLQGRPGTRNGQIGHTSFALDTELAQRVRRSAEILRVDPAIFLEACWHVLISRLSGEEEVSSDGSLDGRKLEELAGAMGALTHSAPIRSRVEPETSFAEVVDQVRRGRAAVEQWLEYQPVALDAPETFGFGFDYVSAEIPKLGDAEMRVTRLSGRGDALSLQMALHDDGTTTRGEVSYDGAAYDERDAAAIVAAFSTLVASAAVDPHEKARRLRLLETDVRTTILESSSGPVADVPKTTVHALFEHEVDRIGKRPAVVDGEGSLTFAELDEEANRLAHHLRWLGVGRNDAVGMCLDRSRATIVALLGILKAGGAYLPLNYEHPAARLGQQLQAADARIVVTQSRLAESLGSYAGTVVELDGHSSQLEACSAERPEGVNEPDDAVYVMYTSGSTGVPKGATIKHQSLVNYALALVEWLGAHDSDGGLSFAAVSAISTDLGNTAIFPALISGGTIHLISPAASLDGAEYAAYAREHPIDVLKITPSHLKGLLAASDLASVLPNRWLVLGGEAASWELVDELRAAGHCRILNHYGPTETTVGCCTYEVRRDGRPSGARTVPIGKPLRNSTVYVVDENQQPLPIGAPGELYVGGAGVARGYVGQPEETALRFVSDPFSSDPASRLYRTGDRVRRLRDGNLEFLGRIDEQVKIRGYRVEPGEVEAVLARHPAVQQAAVIPVHDEGGPRLAAYLVARERPLLDDLLEHVRAAVPEFMVPSEFAFLDALPLTPSGKVDRRALPEIGVVAAGRSAEYVAPRNETEKGIAAIWAEVLGVERVGIRDDFFDLGGHSLMATQVIARVRSTYEAQIPLHLLFATPTVEALAAAVAENRTATADEEVEDLLAQLAHLSDDEAADLLAGHREPEGEQSR